MQGLASARPSARFRTGATLAAAGIVAGALIALDRALHVLIPDERASIGFLAVAVRPDLPVPRRAPATPSGQVARTPAAVAPPSIAIDPQMMQALRCVVRGDGVKRAPDPDCPPPAPFAKPEDWARPNSIPKPALRREELFTAAERATTHKQLAVCGPAGTGGMVCVGPPPPPPPIKSPIEYCRAANMGGPCEPPPQERVVPE